MVRQVRMTPPADQVVPELTSPDQLTEEERRRIAARMPESSRRSRPVADPPAPELVNAEVEMTRRSWYAEREAADALARAVDALHFATRVPKHQVVSLLFRLAAEQQDLVLDHLRRTGQTHP
ncbi:hypothetical protein GCM10009665_79270 [Kitasatospora nipponensis]|uniref:ANTAR domain-containing protein n=1 Tax=Kitasatospora nipponensis TaxID=258049 RepID=A0ABN1TBF0_9ACTN